ncbi:MAG: hypothetical protein BWX57_00523 [Tenericutes bacterium ADurb.Bin024]|nr:MAG: hypothetical protein BWX57_00523 [Tenericutes bacterium ADurb.Bin024]
MVELFFGFLQLSFYIIVFTFIPVTLLVRVLSIIHGKNDVKVNVLVIIDVFSLSYYYFIPKEHRFRKLYNILLFVYLALSIFAFGFGIHMYV